MPQEMRDLRAVCAQQSAADRSRSGPLAGKLARGGEGLGSQIGTRFGGKNVVVLPLPSPWIALGRFPLLLELRRLDMRVQARSCVATSKQSFELE